MQEVLEKYKKEVCKYCTADCYNAKGIVVFKDKDTTYARCVDYKSNRKRKTNNFILVGKEERK